MLLTPSLLPWLRLLPPVFQVAGLNEELAAMHAAWAERDVKQRLADLEMRELTHQVGA